MDISALGKRVRIYRAAHAITQQMLAKRLGVSQSALSLLENDKPAPQLTPAKLERIAKITEMIA